MESEQISKDIIKLLKNRKGELLEIGCGTGVNLKLFNSLGFKTTGIDFSETAIKQARISSPNSEIIFDDFLKHNFNKKFDIIFAYRLIHLFPKSQLPQLFSKINSLMKEDSIAIISSSKDIGNLLEKNFKTISFLEEEWKIYILKQN